MKEYEIDEKRFSRQELQDTLETLLLGFYTSPMSEGKTPNEKEELVLNYKAIQLIILKSAAT